MLRLAEPAKNSVSLAVVAFMVNVDKLKVPDRTSILPLKADLLAFRVTVLPLPWSIISPPDPPKVFGNSLPAVLREEVPL